jgi:hypothetical protein
VKAWRWWDGTGWTSYASDPSPPSSTGTAGAPAAPSYPAYPNYPSYPGYTGYPTYPSYPGYTGYPTYPAYGPSSGSTATAALEVERRSSVWALRAIPVYVVCQVAAQALQWGNRTNLRDSFHRLRVQIDTGVVQQHANLNGSPGRQAASDLLVLAAGAAAILFLVWQYRAAGTARQLSLPAAHSPAMGVGGWFIPVVNFWFPYQALRDCFPPGDPGRRLVLRMWLGWVAIAVAGVVNIVTIFVGPNPTSGLGLVATAITAALIVTVGTLLFRIVRQVGETHGRLAAASGNGHHQPPG